VLRTVAVAVALLVAIDPCAAAPKSTYAPPPTVHAQVAASLKAHRAAGAAAGVIRGGRLVWTGYWGEQSPGVPVGRETLFNVASLAKPVAAETILRLASEGRLSLDEPMSPVWLDPDLAGDPRHARLTPRMALSHRTGFSNWRSREPDGKLRFGADPGTKAGYSGEGYEYLGRFAEKKLGIPFDELVRTRVLEPLGMHSTALVRQPWTAARAAHPMNEKGEWGEQPPRERWSAADDLYVTVEDYAAFLIAVARGDGLTPEIAAERMRIALENDGGCPPAIERLCPKPAGFGLGWEVLRFDDGPMLYHTGGDWAEHTLAYIQPDTGDGLVLFINGGGARGAVREILNALEDPSPLRPALNALHAVDQSAAEK
jgi:CubicO group peptidase (beta-lactamase class C family)